MDEPNLELTYGEICRIAEVLEGRFQGKTMSDLDIAITINTWIEKKREIQLDQIVRIQESRQSDYDLFRKKAYGYPICLYCGCQFCKCG